ncbi:MAG: lipid-A-disaccharide synthase, partial [Bacteroidales bacterium]|nr:lipid-A-disaccharide synthase [Bacteroidales bacterium]
MRYYIIAGEASGDLHGSNLMKGLLKKEPEAEIRFRGGDKMAAVGGVMAQHYRETAVMGVVEIAMNLRKILNDLERCKKDILNFAPDVVILIDYPGFNLKIAKFARNNGIKVFYYIAPKVWAWNEKRVKLLRKYVDGL